MVIKTLDIGAVKEKYTRLRHKLTYVWGGITNLCGNFKWMVPGDRIIHMTG